MRSVARTVTSYRSKKMLPEPQKACANVASQPLGWRRGWAVTISTTLCAPAARRCGVDTQQAHTNPALGAMAAAKVVGPGCTPPSTTPRSNQCWYTSSMCSTTGTPSTNEAAADNEANCGPLDETPLPEEPLLAMKIDADIFR